MNICTHRVSGTTGRPESVWTPDGALELSLMRKYLFKDTALDGNAIFRAFSIRFNLGAL